MKTINDRIEQFKCDICVALAIFKQKGDLNQHVAAVNKGNKPFKCEICNTKIGLNMSALN